MTADGSTNSETYWDEARIALGRVSDLFYENIEFTQEDLSRLENYELIPEQVRQAIEDLTLEERRVVKSFLNTLAQNHFYVEGVGGGVRSWF
jgi:hypothetical protein